MKLLVLSTILLTAPLFAQSTPPAPTPAAPPAVQVATPKETVSSLKLTLNRSQYSSIQQNATIQYQNFYNSQVKPVLDNLDTEAKALQDAVKKENGWGDDHIFNTSSGVWTIKAPETPKK